MPDIRPLSQELAKKAAAELNESPDRLQSDLNALRTWLRQSPHISACTDDQFLVAFLRGFKHRMETVKEKLDLFYTIRSALPQVIRNRDPFEAKTLEILRLGLTVPLPATATPDGPRFIVLRPSAYDPDKYCAEDIFRVSLMVTEVMLQDDDNTIVSGHVAICDVKGLAMGHVTQYTTTMMRKITMFNINASPYRTQTVHYINFPAALSYLFAFAKNFFSEAKINMYVHDSLESLYEHIPRHCLPTEYGGDAGSLTSLNDQLEAKLQSYSDYFKRAEAFGVQENKRPGKPKNAEQLFGTDGTFRSLAID